MQNIMKSTLLLFILITASLSPCIAENAKLIATAEKEQKLPKKIGNVSFEGGNGATIETAIIITGAKNTQEGIEAEAKWVKKVHRTWVKKEQALLMANGKHYDKIQYSTPAGETKSLYFDISSFFGKF